MERNDRNKKNIKQIGILQKESSENKSVEKNNVW